VYASVIVYQLLVCCPECKLNDSSARNLLRHVSDIQPHARHCVSSAATAKLHGFVCGKVK